MSGEAFTSARIADAIRLSAERNTPQFVGFLDERGQEEARAVCRHNRFTGYLFFGGFPEAERSVFGAFPLFLCPEPEEFPIVRVRASFQSVRPLSHRDFLGALISSGVRRESVGDIFVEERSADLFLLEGVAAFVISSVDRVGGAAVRFEACEGAFSRPEQSFREMGGTIASARLDCAVAALLGQSREKAAVLIRSGLVSLRFQPQGSVTEPVREGDTLSIRGSGKYRITQIGPETKKGRLVFRAKKYL